MSNIMVTGGAGFIGSHLCDALIARGDRVVCVDNLQRGNMGTIHHLIGNESFAFYEIDVCDQGAVEDILKKHEIDAVYHLAANTDLWESMKNPAIEHECTFETTRSVLEAMKNTNIKNLFFASTSAIYGEQKEDKAFEESDLLFPISYYGAAKMAAEAYVYAYAYMNDMKVLIYRFSNIIGGRMTHGVIRDFIMRLLDDPSHLDVRGNGYQTKPYLHVSELIRAIMMTELLEDGVHIYNVGAVSSSNVRFIANAVVERLGLTDIPVNYEERTGGWKGDVARYDYDVTRINQKGWFSLMNSDETVIRAVAEIAEDCLTSRVQV